MGTPARPCAAPKEQDLISPGREPRVGSHPPLQVPKGRPELQSKRYAGSKSTREPEGRPSGTWGTVYGCTTRGSHPGLFKFCSFGAISAESPRRTAATCRSDVPGESPALVSVYPKVSGRPEPGLLADVRVDDLARQLDLQPADLRAALPAKQIQARQIPGLYLYAEGYAFRSREEIDRFLAKLEGAAASGVSAAPSGLIG
jgi:hypothetical protein